MSLNLNYKPEAVVDISGLSREEWLDYRKKGIGGSDAAAIMGVSPFATKRDLFYDKTGIRPAFQENEDNWVAKEVGHRLEDLVAEIFSKKTGLKIFPVRTMFRHPLYPFMLADVDFFIEFADVLNDRLWEIVNPKDSWKAELKAGNALYREGDRIIHNKNKNDISNGDIGYITDIYQDEDGVDLMRLSFSDGRIAEYSAEDADLIEHAYTTTVHKSQGSEYKVVILPWLPMFYMMLRRNILYTAVTRAKEKIVIVGSKKSLYQAIHNTACDKRNTRLGERIVREYNALLTKKASA